MKQILKPCPFCGTIPVVITDDRDVIPNQIREGVVVKQRVNIECRKCFCEKDIISWRTLPNESTAKEQRNLQKTLARETIENFWNRRKWEET